MELLDKLEIGMPVVVTLNDDIRIVSIYAGIGDRGYRFYDGSGITGVFIYGKDYLSRHPEIQFTTELGEDEDVDIVARLVHELLEMKGGE